MIFRDILDGKGKILGPEFSALLDRARKNQKHPGDLLLLHVNGFYQEETLEWNKTRENKLNPHVVGPGLEGHSEHAHYSFIDKYRNIISEKTHSEYTAMHTIEKWTAEKGKEIEALLNAEETSIQLEMLIYLKIWEADLIIKKFYQFTRILYGEDYDWHFKIGSAKKKGQAGKRHEIIRLQFRDKIKSFSPILYEYVAKTYKTQIRNSIAHSNYSFQGRYIHLNNFIKEDPYSQLKEVSFDEWIDIFHNTLIIYNEYIRMGNAINEHFGQIAMTHNNLFPIKITERDGNQYELFLEYRPERKDWGYKQYRQ